MDQRTQKFSGSRRCFRNILEVLLFFRVLLQVESDGILLRPTNVHVNGSELTWNPASEQRDVTYTAEYLRSGRWKPVPDCRNTSLTSCDLSSIQSQSIKDCALFRVHAHRSQLRSESVEACSSRGGPCSPDVHVTAAPGSLTVHLSMNNSLYLEYADHLKHVVYFGKEGEELKEHSYSGSSVFIENLDAGQRFCVEVQFTVYDQNIGPASCVQCETIPESISSNQKTIITVLVLVVVLVVLVVGIAYVLICKSKEIKKFLRPPYTIPEDFLEPYLRDIPILPSSPTEERYDLVSIVTPNESRGS